MPRVLLLLCVLVAGCYSTSTTDVRRARVWTQPGSPVFVWMVRDRTTTYRVLGTDDDDGSFEWDETTSTRTDRTWVLAVDPLTRKSTQLAWTSGAARPFFWDARRSILWVEDEEDGSIVGLTRSGVTWVPGRWSTFRTRASLPAPFAVGGTRRRARLFDASTHAEITLPAADLEGSGHRDGSLLRIASVAEDGDVLQLRQVVIDWSAGTPRRQPDLHWTSPRLDPARGTRRGVELTGDGRRVLELLATPAGPRLVIHDPVTVTPSFELELGAEPAPDELALHVLDHDTAIVAAPDEKGCRRGHVIAASTRTVAALAADACITGVERVRGIDRALLRLDRDRFGFVDPAGQIGDLGETTPVAAGGSTVVHVRVTGSDTLVELVDLATGARSQLAQQPGGRVVGYHDGLLFVQHDDRIEARRSDGATTAVELPSRLGDEPQGMPRVYATSGIGERPERTKLWIGMGLAATTKSGLALDGFVQLRRWQTTRVAWSIGAGMLFEYDDFSEKPARQDVFGSLGVRGFADRRLGGWFAGLELGLGASDLRQPDDTLDRSFLARGTAGVGWQGRLFVFQASALLPSLDLDRGVAFVASFGIGTLGANL